MYHRIDKPNHRSLVPGHYVSPKLFERQLLFLKKLKFQTIGLGQLDPARWPEGGRHVVLTFDDGYLNFFLNALPVLNGLKMTSTVFLVSDLIGGTNVWDQALGDVEERLMSQEQIEQVLASGHEIGSHSRSHPDLRQLGAKTLEDEVLESKRQLEQQFGMQIKWFCYPYGHFNTSVLDTVAKSGYCGATSTIKGANLRTTDRLQWRRINVRRDTGLPVLWLKLVRAIRFGKA